jgi:ParB/RepB/Spo0J family partition protein
MRAARKSAAALAAFAAAPAAGVEPLPLGIDRLPIGRIFPSPLNPRKRIAEDGLAELETSIARNGILQPITVRPAAEADRAKGDWEIVMGARRWTAASRAVASGKMPADYAAPVIVRPCSDEELVTLAATENMARKDMHPLEEAEVLEALRQTMRPELGPRDTKEAAAGRVVGMPERTVFRRLALLRLAPELRERLLADEITLGQAYAFIPAPPKVQLETFRELTKGRKTGLAGIADDTIGRALLGHAFCLDAARFALKALKGDVVQAFGRKWTFAVAEARKLQGDWIDARLAELAKMRPWVERVDSSIWQRGYRDAPRGAKDKRAGFVLQVHPETYEVFELDYVLRAADVAADEAKRRGDKASGAAGAGERPRKAMTEPQLVAAKWAKSEAIRLAVTEDPRAGLAVTILGLLGAVEVRIGTPTSGHPHVSNPKKPVPAREALIAKALAPIATVLKRGKVEVGFFGGKVGTGGRAAPPPRARSRGPRPPPGGARRRPGRRVVPLPEPRRQRHRRHRFCDRARRRARRLGAAPCHLAARRGLFPRHVARPPRRPGRRRRRVRGCGERQESRACQMVRGAKARVLAPGPVPRAPLCRPWRHRRRHPGSGRAVTSPPTRNMAEAARGALALLATGAMAALVVWFIVDVLNAIGCGL